MARPTPDSPVAERKDYLRPLRGAEWLREYKRLFPKNSYEGGIIGGEDGESFLQELIDATDNPQPSSSAGDDV